jgi:hypothetical protein
VRDAQRLVVDRGLVREFGPILDAQSVRLQNAQDRLTGVHPDYWLYLTELRASPSGCARWSPRPASGRESVVRLVADRHVAGRGDLAVQPQPPHEQ